MSELERGILAALAMRPSLFEASDCTAEDFSPGRQREMFSLMAELWESERPDDEAGIDLARIADRLEGDCPATYCAEIIDGQIRVEPETFRRRVAELKHRRRSGQIVAEALRLGQIHLKTGAFDREGYAELSRLIVEQGANGSGPTDVSRVLKMGSELQALDVHIEFAVDKLIPDQALTLFHGRGGIGKTWAALQIGGAVSTGDSIFGLATKKRPVVYIDFENPLSTMIDRVRRLDVGSVQFWLPTATPRPPKLDSDDYVLYKSLPAGALIIIDSLRSSYSGDENSSRDMAVVMGRLLELRDCGFTLLINHHTPKGNEKTYKGSTAISDLVDHVLSFYKVRAQSFEELDDDLGPMPGDTFYLGTRDKTRFEPVKLFLTFMEGGGFGPAEDPDSDELSSILDYLRERGGGLTQSDVWAWAKAELGIGKKLKLVSLLRKGEAARLWVSRRDGRRRVYETP